MRNFIVFKRICRRIWWAMLVVLCGLCGAGCAVRAVLYGLPVESSPAGWIRCLWFE
ncbi:hypothetical protein KJY78_04190 [Canibacter sp. lx-45]|uniref:hypothetical protein n=1 Tax=Canibacter zhuwentaonis TaxID=2837491 RepID=UPI001BDBD30C|nr:hypothetical protein [Canibacter zhuwentaonis]MBT1035553.1 hypothetical protein [Canibacter zhuwentaonis]